MISYNTVIRGFFKEGEAAKACDLFNGMVQLGISPTVMTYNLVIDALCKARAIDKAEVVLQQMVGKGLEPNTMAYNILIHAYSSAGRRQWKEAVRVFKEMTRCAVPPSAATCNSFMSSFASMGEETKLGIYLTPWSRRAKNQT